MQIADDGAWHPHSQDDSATTLRIFYPSGAMLRIKGVEGAGIMEDLHGSFVVTAREKKALVLDPRCVAICPAGWEIVYAPSMSDCLPDWAKQWLTAHPEWPPQSFHWDPSVAMDFP